MGQDSGGEWEHIRPNLLQIRLSLVYYYIVWKEWWEAERRWTRENIFYLHPLQHCINCWMSIYSVGEDKLSENKKNANSKWHHTRWCVRALLRRFMFVFQLNLNLLNAKCTTSVAFLESNTDSRATHCLGRLLPMLPITAGFLKSKFSFNRYAMIWHKFENFPKKNPVSVFCADASVCHILCPNERRSIVPSLDLACVLREIGLLCMHVQAFNSHRSGKLFLDEEGTRFQHIRNKKKTIPSALSNSIIHELRDFNGPKGWFFLI